MAFISVSLLSCLTSLHHSALTLHLSSRHGQTVEVCSCSLLEQRVADYTDILLCLCRSSFIFFPSGYPCGILISFIYAVVICCSILCVQCPAVISKDNNRSEDGLVNDLLSFLWYIPVLRLPVHMGKAHKNCIIPV